MKCRNSCGLLRVSGMVRAFCWGFGARGQLGQGMDVFDDALAPRMVVGGAGWTNIATGWSHSCGVRGTDLLCWGDNREGKLGNGDMMMMNTTVPVDIVLE